MLVSVGLLAVVGIMPLFSGSMLRFELKLESESAGGFKRRTSSLSSCRILDPRVPNHPDALVFCVIAIPADVLPYRSNEVTPTIVNHNRSLSSLPNSEASEYIIDDIGSE